MGRLTSLKSSLQSQPSKLSTINPDSWRAGKETSAQRGYGYKWQKARAAWIEAHPLCEYCKREGRVTAATVVDHSTPHRGDMTIFWERTKWVSLCTNCHSSVKQLEENADRSR
jgi:5-methylcytosine-specific restriction endonuclease McrA